MAKVSFSEGQFPQIDVPEDRPLSEVLDATNSPVLFGCRTGVCGTCLIEINPQAMTQLAPASESERELLSIICPENSCARLACQLIPIHDLSLKYIG